MLIDDEKFTSLLVKNMRKPPDKQCLEGIENRIIDRVIAFQNAKNESLINSQITRSKVYARMFFAASMMLGLLSLSVFIDSGLILNTAPIENLTHISNSQFDDFASEVFICVITIVGLLYLMNRLIGDSHFIRLRNVTDT